MLVGRAFLFFDVPLALSCCSPVVAPDCALGWPIWAMSLRYLAPRAEVPPTSRFKYLESQPALSALNDTKGVLEHCFARNGKAVPAQDLNPRSVFNSVAGFNCVSEP